MNYILNRSTRVFWNTDDGEFGLIESPGEEASADTTLRFTATTTITLQYNNQSYNQIKIVSTKRLQINPD